MYSAGCWNQPFSGDGILRNRCWRLLCHSLEWKIDATQRGQGTIMWYVLCVTKSTCAPTVFVRVWFKELAQNHCQINTKDMRNYLSVSLKSWMIYMLFSHIFPMKPVVISTCFLEISKFRWCTLALPVKSVIPCCKPWHQTRQNLHSQITNFRIQWRAMPAVHWMLLSTMHSNLLPQLPLSVEFHSMFRTFRPADNLGSQHWRQQPLQPH